MKQDILHVRDAVSKTITVHDNFITIRSDFDVDELVVDSKWSNEIERMFSFAKDKADEMHERHNGILLNISGGRYDKEIGSPAQTIWVDARRVK